MKFLSATLRKICSLFRKTAGPDVKFREAANKIPGEIINAGAGEFLAKTPLGEIHGTLHGVPADEDVPAGTQIEIFIRPEILQISDCPPEENFFVLKANSAGTLSPHGNAWTRSWALRDGFFLRIDSRERSILEPEDDVFAWAFPEDIAAFPRTQNHCPR